MPKKSLLKNYKESLKSEIFDYSTISDIETFETLTIFNKKKVLLSKINKKISNNINDIGFDSLDVIHLIYDTPLCFVFCNNRDIGLKNYEVDFLMSESKLKGFTLWNGTSPIMHALNGVAELQVELSESQWWYLLNNVGLEEIADKNKGENSPTVLMVACYYLSSCRSKLTQQQWDYLFDCSDVQYAIDHMLKMPVFDYLESKMLDGLLFLTSMVENKLLSKDVIYNGVMSEKLSKI